MTWTGLNRGWGQKIYTTEFLALREGFEQLPRTLAEQFQNKFSGCLHSDQRVHMNHRLVRIEYNKKGGKYPYTLPARTATALQRYLP